MQKTDRCRKDCPGGRAVFFCRYCMGRRNRFTVEKKKKSKNVRILLIDTNGHLPVGFRKMHA